MNFKSNLTRPGWKITVKEGSKATTILIYKDSLQDAIRELKALDPTKKVIHIARHG